MRVDHTSYWGKEEAPEELMEQPQVLTEGVEIPERTYRNDLQVVFEKQIAVIEKLQVEILDEPANAYTPHKVDALREAAVALINLTVAKRNLETL